MGTLIAVLMMLAFVALMVAALVKQHRRRVQRRQEIAKENEELLASIRAKYASVKLARRQE